MLRHSTKVLCLQISRETGKVKHTEKDVKICSSIQKVRNWWRLSGSDLYYLLVQALLSSYNQDQRWLIAQMTATLPV